MDPTTDLDRIRAWVEGDLPPQEAARLERELAQDPELAELAERFRDVHVLTAAEEPPPPCRVTFEDLERRLLAERPARAWPRRAAAALVLLASGATLAYVALRGPGQGPGAAPAPVVAAGRVELHAITLAPEPVAEKPILVPEILASYDPVGGQGIHWLDDWPSAISIARASGRPLLVFGTLPGCLWCAELRATVLNRPEVLALADRYVPIEWNLATLPEAEQAMIQRYRGYPLLEVWTVDDETVLNFSGRPDAQRFEEMMHQGLERAGATGEVPEWHEVRDLAQRWQRAREAEEQGRVAEAQAALRDLARRDEEGGLFRGASVAALRRIAGEARSALLAARDAAASEPGRARERLRESLLRYRGTAFEVDLRAVIDAWTVGASFPELVQAPGS